MAFEQRSFIGTRDSKLTVAFGVPRIPRINDRNIRRRRIKGWQQKLWRQFFCAKFFCRYSAANSLP
jgi:hypothetical protein